MSALFHDLAETASTRTFATVLRIVSYVEEEVAAISVSITPEMTKQDSRMTMHIPSGGSKLEEIGRHMGVLIDLDELTWR